MKKESVISNPAEKILFFINLFIELF